MASTHPEGRQERTFLDTPLARLIGLIFAIGIGYLMYSAWSEDFRELVEGTPPALPIIEPAADLSQDNPGLAACLEQRVGDVDKMLSDGIIDDGQHAAFRLRAESLCREQNQFPN